MSVMEKEMETCQLSERQNIIEKITQVTSWDMVVIGGGITGAGIAREAARQGASVLILEQKDFSWGSSSRSSKMVHGGLRYLAAGNLKLTSHSVKERERLMNEAPGLVELMSYSWPHYGGQFPGPKVFNGLLAVYDFFAGKRYRHYLNKEQALYDLPNISHEGLIGSTRFADAITDDSRLVMRVLEEAEHDGATMLNYCKVEELIKKNDLVTGVIAKDAVSGDQYSIHAKVVISATGAWADTLRAQLGEENKIRPLRGSHLVFPSWRLPTAQSITMKHPKDGRSMFIFPWEGMTVVGTTDLDDSAVEGSEPYIREEEVQYLLESIEHLFPGSNIKREDIISSFAGVRPIVSSGALNPSAEKRDHTIWDDHGLISVSGGKLTTFRLIALDVLKVASKYLKNLDGRDYGHAIFRPVTNVPTELKKLDKHWVHRLLGFYGQDIQGLCDCAQGDWALVPGTKVFWAQVRFAARSEKVVNLDDLMLRRTRIGLYLRQGGTEFQAQIKSICQQEMSWDDKTWNEQWQRYSDLWSKYYSVPSL